MKRKGLFISILFSLIFICMLSLNVQAAEKKVSVRISGKYEGTITNTDGRWRLSSEEYKLPGRAVIRFLGLKKGSPLKSGFYFISKAGFVYTSEGVRQLKYSSEAARYYYFGTDGRRCSKKGWVTTSRGERYYVSSKGRIYTDCWVSGYYLMSNGKIAKNMKTPDGHYVDCDGRKCSENEVALSGFKKTLQSQISKMPGIWSVYVKDLKTGDELLINDQNMIAASVIKLFVMESTYHSIKNKKLEETSRVKSLLNSMITVSSNEAYNELIRLHSSSRNFLEGARTINKYLKKNGYTTTEVNRTLHPSSSFSISQGSNKISAKDTGLLLERIATNKCVSPSASQKMKALLMNQTRRWKIPSGLPLGIKCGNKTGENSSAQNDAAIVYGKKTDYVVCIFSNHAGEYAGINGIRTLSRMIYDRLNS